jgi:alpha-tubulin suppressor-like RCC1 family protein
MGRRRIVIALLLVGLVGLAPRAVTAEASPEPGPRQFLSGVAQVGAGGLFSCARLTNGTVRCWGASADGQIGNGGVPSTSTTAVVKSPSGAGPLQGVTQISVGSEHACAHLSTNEIVCWGRNQHGQLGDGSTANWSRPHYVENIGGTAYLRAVSVAAGNEHTCAVVAQGPRTRQAVCWGRNQAGQLGDGSTDDSPTPVGVDTDETHRLTRVEEITAGLDHSCARLTSGQARCWGDGQSGEIGNDAFDQQLWAVPVLNEAGSANLTAVGQIDAGDNRTCVTLTSAQVRCWGDDTPDVSDDGIGSALPVIIKRTNLAALTGVRQVSAGGTHACATTTRRMEVWCWGHNGNGQLATGDGTQSDIAIRARTAAATSLIGGLQVSAGGSHTCARIDGGTVRCWGNNLSGQVGDGTGDNNRMFAVRVRA